MGRLNHFKYYLCGQIENNPAEREWRRNMAVELGEINNTSVVWDPLIKPAWFGEKDISVAFDKSALFYGCNGQDSSSQEMLDRRALSLSTNIRARKLCQNLVSSCDIVIARITTQFTWGSIDELEIAIRRQIPIFMWMPQGPLGTYGMPGITEDPTLLPEYIHYTKESLLAKIRDVDSGSGKLLDLDPMRWVALTYPNARI